MTMTLAQLKAEITDVVGEQHSSDVVRLINKGIEKLALMSKLITPATLAVSNGVATLPADCLVVRSVYYGDVPLERLTEDIVPTYTGQLPLYWSKAGSTLTVTPKLTSGSITVAYTSKGTDMALEADTPGIDNADDYLIARTCYKILLKSEGDTPLTRLWRDEYESEKADWIKMNSESERRSYIGKRPSYK